MEFITSNFDQLNWWAIIVATISTMPVGYVWYDLKMGFGKRWAKMNGLSEKELSSTDGMAKTFGLMLLTSLLTAVIMASFIIATDVSGFWESLVFGLIFGVVLRGGAHIIHNGFTRKPMELTFIDVGHDMVSLSVVAVILGLWQ